MRPKIYVSCSLFIAIILCISARDLAAQSVNQEIEDTALLLGQGSEIPQLGPVQIERMDAPGIAVTEDQHGFMWFGGADGLYRYDGFEYVHYQHDPFDSTTLSSSAVEALHVDSEGTLWVGTYGAGLNRFEPDTDTFTHFQYDRSDPLSLSQDSVSVIMEDREGFLWVGTMGGLNRFDKTTQTFTRYLHDPNDSNSLSNNQVRALYEDSNGTIWIGTGSPELSETPLEEGGLNRFHPKSETFTRYLHDPSDSTSLISNKIMSLYEDSRGTFWIGTSGDGLHSMNRETGSFKRHRFDPNDPAKISSPFLEGVTDIPDDCTGFVCGGVTFVHEDSQGMLWIGSMYGGVNRYDLSTGAMSHYESNNSGIIGNNTIWNIHESQDGTLWVGAWEGLHKISAAVNFFPHLNNSETYASEFLEDSQHRIWGNGFSRLYRLDRSSGEFFYYQSEDNDPNSLFSPNIYSMALDPTGNLWVTYYTGGISRYNQSEDHFDHYFTDPESLIRLQRSIALLADRNGQLWVGTWNGLYELDPLSETFIDHFDYTPDDLNSLSDSRVIVLHEDSEGTIWTGTGNGLNRIDRDQNRSPSHDMIQQFLLGRIIMSLFEDTNGHLWVGTWGDGLYELDPSSGQTVHHYDIDDGLPSNRIASVIRDDYGDLWITTSDGQFQAPVQGKLTRFNSEAGSFTTFSHQDGLPNIGFHSDRAFKTHDGLLLFGGNGGFTFFDPSVIQDPSYTPPKIALTGLQVSNEEILPGPDEILNRPVYLEEFIEVNYQQNDITFDYTAFAYNNADQIQYEYQLEPYDSDWVKARTQRSARYSQLPPGEYQFRARTIDSRGVYSVNEATLGISILPPCWRTWWAYGLYVLILALGVFAVDRFQRGRLVAKERERARERELKQEKKYSQQLQEAYSELEDSLTKLTAAQDQLVQQEKLASLGQLTAGIAHEIKNPLNFVNNFSDLSIELVEETKEELSTLSSQLSANEKEKVNYTLTILDDIEANLRKIHEHGTRADGIVKSMLQHSRGGEGKMEPTDLNSLIKEYINLSFHGMLAGENPINVDIDLQLDPSVGEVPLVAEDFSRVILNLCNNAFDAMREKLNEIPKGISNEPPFDGSINKYEAKLTVRTQRKNDTVTIEIEDNGPGIPNEIKDKILQPFFTTKKGTAGTGLGLSITNDIVKAHGGFLDVSSNETSGTTFVIKLPQKSNL